MKKVFSSPDDVTHLFAQRSQEEARTSSNSVYMQQSWNSKKPYADLIYSYGRHYLLGVFLDAADSREILIINDSGYSVSTSRHISSLRSASSHLETYGLTEYGLRHVHSRINNLYEKLLNARKPEMYVAAIVKLADNLNAFKDKTGRYLINDGDRSMNLLKPSELTKEHKGMLKHIKQWLSCLNPEQIRAAGEAARQAAIKEAAKQVRREKKLLAKWLSGESNGSVYGLSEDYLRLNANKTMVETTKNVSVSIQEAAKLYKLIQAGVDIRGYVINGYTVTSINGSLNINCHSINIKNMHKVGKTILKILESK